MVGDLLQSGVIGYLAITDIQSQITARVTDIVYYREPSYGTFQTSARINFFFGVPQSITMTGVLMDMDRMKTSAECKTNCWNEWVDFNRSTGSSLSMYEHAVPELLFSTQDNSVEGISAIKALSIASQQGQRVYTITQDNLNIALPSLTVAQDIKAEIQAAVQNGMEATVSQHPISYAGWAGNGYTIIDPETGAGAYKINGGSNGGEVSDSGPFDISGFFISSAHADPLDRLGKADNATTFLEAMLDCSNLDGNQFIAALTSVLLSIIMIALLTYMIFVFANLALLTLGLGVSLALTLARITAFIVGAILGNIFVDKTKQGSGCSSN